MALIAEAFDDLLVRTACALAPYGESAVLIGGSASALYRYHPASAALKTRPPLTTDADIAAPATGFPKYPPLLAALADAGLSPVPENVPTNKYRLKPAANETVEILCPMTGRSRAVKESSPTADIHSAQVAA